MINNREAGIFINGSIPPKRAIVSRNRVYQNCTSGSGSTGNICADTAWDTIIADNDVGENDTTADGINNTLNSNRTTIRGNRIIAIKSGGAAIKLAQPLTTVFEIHGNAFIQGSGTYISGLDIVPIRRKSSTANTSGYITEYSAKISAMSGAAPSFGSYTIEDRIWIEGATTGLADLVKLTAAGWKTVATVS